MSKRTWARQFQTGERLSHDMLNAAERMAPRRRSKAECLKAIDKAIGKCSRRIARAVQSGNVEYAHKVTELRNRLILSRVSTMEHQIEDAAYQDAHPHAVMHGRRQHTVDGHLKRFSWKDAVADQFDKQS